MTENKRYIPSHNGTEDGLLDKSTKTEYYGFDLANLVNKLNEEITTMKGSFDEGNEIIGELQKENEELKQVYDKLRHRHSLLYDMYNDVECERDSLKKDVSSLEKENEQLKKENRQLKDFLDDNCVLCGANLKLFYEEKYGDSE